MFGLIKHFYKHGKHTATTEFNGIETKFILYSFVCGNTT